MNKVEEIEIFIDGSSKGNPGPAGIAFLIRELPSGKEKKFSKFLGNLTNNEAEYLALIFALKKVKALYGKKIIKEIPLRVYSDSQLLVNQLKGNYKVLDSKIQKLFLTAWNLKIDFKNLKINLISRQKNKLVDRLAKKIISQANR